MSAAARIGKENMEKTLAQLANANENTWMLIGKRLSKKCLASFTNIPGAVAEQVQDQDKALRAFETALKHNPNSVLALNAVASIARSRDDFDKAIEYFQRILNIKQDNGEVWGSMGEQFAIPMPAVKLTKPRTLSVDEGRSAKSIHCLSTSTLPSPKPKGEYLKPFWSILC
jgi:tetratricopeptide (TPR) repeat protein